MFLCTTSIVSCNVYNCSDYFKGELGPVRVCTCGGGNHHQRYSDASRPLPDYGKFRSLKNNYKKTWPMRFLHISGIRQFLVGFKNLY